MNIRAFILALLFFIATSVVVLALVFDMYGTNGYNINLAGDNSTSVLSGLQADVNSSQTKLGSQSDILWNRTVGADGAPVGTSGTIDSGTVMQNSLISLTKTGQFLGVFNTMVFAIFQAVGLGNNNPIFWFFTTATLIVIGLILIGAVLWREL